MAHSQDTDRLQAHLIHMIALEAGIEKRLGALLAETSDHAAVMALLSHFKHRAAIQRLALENRLRFLGGDKPDSENFPLAAAVNATSEGTELPATTALQSAYGLFSQAIVGYAVLHPLATRFADGPVLAEAGTAYHLCRQHAQNYIDGIQQISGMLHDVVLWELDRGHLECQCNCPSCGVGVCVCALAGRGFLRQAWLEAGAIAADEGVYLHPPRQDSKALKVGLREGDVILAAEGQYLESYGDLQTAVRSAGPGGQVQLTVRRGSGQTEAVNLSP